VERRAGFALSQACLWQAFGTSVALGKHLAEEPEEDASGRIDDPARMCLREMGGVELLSRAGDVSIAKRIGSGK